MDILGNKFNGSKPNITPEQFFKVWELYSRDPSISYRRAALTLGMDKWKVRKIVAWFEKIGLIASYQPRTNARFVTVPLVTIYEETL